MPTTLPLSYHRRSCQPPVAVWLSRDPVEERGGLNLYGFVGNDCISGVDLVGLALVAPRGPFDGKHPNIKGCSPGECCAENLSRLYQHATAAITRRQFDFTDAYRAKALMGTEMYPSKNLPFKNYTESWNKHREAFLNQLKAAGYCIKVLQDQIDSGQCVPKPPTLGNFGKFKPLLDQLDDPGEIVEQPHSGPNGPGLIIIGSGIILTTLVEDGITGGAGIADDSVTIGIGGAAIRAGCKCLRPGFCCLLVYFYGNTYRSIRT